MEHFGNFTMYAKDREVVGAICLMKGVNDYLLYVACLMIYSKPEFVFGIFISTMQL